jgi:hypothetical protein
MKKKIKSRKKGFDQKFDAGETVVDFSKGVVTPGLSKTIKLPPLDVPTGA